MDKDPYNVVVAGVGGQGNVLGTQLLGAVLVDQGYKVTIGETYGASQRGGSVMSHMRVSKTDQYGPLIPPRCADLVVALEPTEAVRVLAQFGNRDTIAVVNTRPIFPIDVTCGNLPYPEKDALMAKIIALSKKTFFLEATEKALELGNPILANIIMIGAVSGAGILSITESELAKAIRENIAPDKVDVNLKAFNIGKEMTGCK
ncbi:MAG: indolepyruvate oxidoreductase subunit beta [Pseudomonadota bacterium]